VDDEQAITQNLGPFLERAGFAVAVAENGARALAQIEVLDPDLIVLDVLMPPPDGRAVLRALRAAGRTVPVILLTQVGEAVERAMALEEGADDYLNKPFDPHELVARVRAVLRRMGTGAGPPLGGAARLCCGEVVLDRSAQRVYRNGVELWMTPRATALLSYLMSHPDELLSRERLLEAVWGWTCQAGSRAVDTRIAELRRALNDDPVTPRYITTVPGQGYRFNADVRSA
jgi:DNA-binding response OmpR family regulator